MLDDKYSLSLDKHSYTKGFSAARSYYCRGYNPVDITKAVSQNQDVRSEINVTQGGPRELICLEAGANSATSKYLKDQLKKNDILYSRRAFVHWVVGCGIEDGDVREGSNYLYHLIDQLDLQQLDTIDDSDGDGY